MEKKSALENSNNEVSKPQGKYLVHAAAESSSMIISSSKFFIICFNRFLDALSHVWTLDFFRLRGGMDHTSGYVSHYRGHGKPK